MKNFKYLLVSILAITILVGCGGDEKKEKKSNTIKIKSKKGSKSTNNMLANVVVTSNDLMKFNTSEIKVKKGQKVKLTLRHLGKLDINIMGHNIVILKKGVNLVEFAGKAATEAKNEYIPAGTQDIIAHTKLIGGGQVTSIEFDAPEPGTYEFLCSFPGHFGMMRGMFIVE